MKIKSPLIVILLCTLLLCIYLPRVHAESLRCGDSDVLCGPQSLLVICQSLGVDADLDELRNLSGLDEKTGTTMLGLKKAAEAKGLRAVENSARFCPREMALRAWHGSHKKTTHSYCLRHRWKGGVCYNILEQAQCSNGNAA